MRYNRKWQVCIQTLETCNPKKPETVVTTTILSVPMAASLYLQFQDKALTFSRRIRFLNDIKKGEFLVTPTIATAAFVPWTPKHGFLEEKDRLAYFYKNKVRVRFTLQPLE